MTYSSKFSYSYKQIFRLRLYYGILVKLLDTHLGGTHVLISEDINRIYLQLCIKIEELLKESIFKKLFMIISRLYEDNFFELEQTFYSIIIRKSIS